MMMRSLVDVSDLVGLPYKVHGRDETGIDCFGLIWLIALRNGTPIKDVYYKGFSPELMCFAEQMNVEKCALQPGCVVEIEKGGRLHLGYALDNKMMVHATRSDGVVVENIDKYNVKGYYKFS